MKIHALKYSTSLSDYGPVPVIFDIKTQEDLKPYLNLEEPTLYLINQDDASRILNLKDIIINRGTKHPAKSLSFYLLKKDIIPLVDGNFTGTSQVKRSIKAFLKNAVKTKENKLFLVTAAPDIFTETNCGQIAGNKSYNIMARPKDDDQNRKLSYLGDSEKIEKVRQNILVAAKVNYPVLILGPSGTGKELVANEIHINSKRANNNMITVNCGAIPENLLESELFGYKKGAFSGAAADKVGKWKLADKGTLFLDEIGDLKLDHQVKILRAISTNTFYPVGSEKAEKADVRILAATNRDIHPLSHKDQFREDLYYRLAGIIIQTPALKNHAEDIPGMVDKIWPKIIKENMDSKKNKDKILNPELSAEVIRKLQTMHWPGNVRQLKNILRRLYAYVGELKTINADDLVSVVQYETAGASKETEKIAKIHRIKQAMAIFQATEATLDFRIKNYDPEYTQESFIDAGAQFHLDEIDSLCKDPLNLSEPVFLILNDLKGKLIYFSHLFNQNSEEAFGYWKNQVKPTLKSSLEKVHEEYSKFSDSA
ncbi:MAG: sigma 54-interacting transcriptional regulator [Pseudomonadota bacterium]